VDKILELIQENRAREISREEQEEAEGARNPRFQWERVPMTRRELRSNIRASEFLQL